MSDGKIARVTQRERIQRVPERWREQYCERGKWTYGDDKRAIAATLDALDLATVSVEMITKIIGNDSWTAENCRVCGDDATEGVQIEDKYDEGLWTLCLACARSVGRAAVRKAVP